MSAISTLPEIGKKRASRIILARPFKNAKEFAAAVDDATVAERLIDMITFKTE
jgi:DNA uptake protein ComE-like DNA-binding protein